MRAAATAMITSCQNRRMRTRVETTMIAVRIISGRYSGMSMLLDDESAHH